MFESLTEVRTAQARREHSSNFELFGWFFMRLSGIALLLMAVFHLLYMHFVIGVENTTFEVIVQRWENPLWRLFDLFLLFFAWTHGANGMRYIVDDYIHTQGWRVTVKTLLYALYFAILLMGAYVIFTLNV